MKNIKLITIMIIGLIIISCGNSKMQEKIENQCDLDHIRSIKNDTISFFEVSESKRELVTKPVKNVNQLIVLCKSDSIFPKEIGQLINLKKLTVMRGNFNHLPHEIGDLINLEILILANTSIKNLPIELYKLPNLKRVAIMYNMEEFEFGEDLCKNDISLEVWYTSTKLKEMPNCLEKSDKIKLVNKEAY